MQIIEVSLGNYLTLEIIALGAFHTIMDENIAKALKLPVVSVHWRDCGINCTAGNTMMHYPGRVECQVKMRLGP